MAALATVTAGLFVLVLGALLLPWHVRVLGRTAPGELRVQLRLLGGYAPAIPLPLQSVAGRATRPKDRPRKQRRRPRRFRGFRGLADLVPALLAAFSFDRLRLSGTFGLSDPADTGTLWGLLAPFVHTIGAPDGRIDIAPDFTGPCLDLEGAGDLVIRPVRLIGAGLAFARANRGRT